MYNGLKPCPFCGGEKEFEALAPEVWNRRAGENK